VAGIGRCTQARGGGSLQFRQETGFDGLGAVGLELFGALLTLRRGWSLVKIGFRPAQRGGGKAEVDVLREPVDDVEDLGERGAALEDAGWTQIGCGEDAAEEPADPEVLFDDELRDAGVLRIVAPVQ